MSVKIVTPSDFGSPFDTVTDPTKVNLKYATPSELVAGAANRVANVADVAIRSKLWASGQAIIAGERRHVTANGIEYVALSNHTASAGNQPGTAGANTIWLPLIGRNHGVLANKAALDALNPRDGDTATVLDPLGITGCIKNCAVDLVRVSDAWVVSQQHERILFTNDASHNKGVFGKKVLDYRSVSTQAGFIVVKTAIPVGTEADLVVRLRAIHFVLGMIDVSIFAYLQAVGYYSPSLRYRNLTVGQYNPNCYIGNSSDGKIVYIFGSNSDTLSSNFIAGVYATSGSRNFETVLGFLTGWELSFDSTPMTGTPASGTGVLGTITNIKQITAA